MSRYLYILPEWRRMTDKGCQEVHCIIARDNNECLKLLHDSYQGTDVLHGYPSAYLLMQESLRVGNKYKLSDEYIESRVVY